MTIFVHVQNRREENRRSFWSRRVESKRKESSKKRRKLVDSDSDESFSMSQSAEPEDSPEELYVVEKILDVRIRKGVSHCHFDIMHYRPSLH